MSELRAFISSHASLRDYADVDFHALAANVASEFGIRAVGMDAHEPSPDLQARCLKSVREADVVIMIVGWSYGRAHDGTRSLTEIEYDTAIETSKAVVALIDGNAAPQEMDPGDLARAIAWRARFDALGDRPLYGTFRDASSFASALRQGLSAIITGESYRVLTRSSPEMRDRAARLCDEPSGLTALSKTRIVREAMLMAVDVEATSATQPEYMLTVAGIEIDDPYQEKPTRLRDAASCFPEHPRLIICGEFGCGKSDFTELLRLRALQGLKDRPEAWHVPLRVDLSKWDEAVETFRVFVDKSAEAEYGKRVWPEDLFLIVEGSDNRVRPLEADLEDEIVKWLATHRWAWAVVAVRTMEGLGCALKTSPLELGFARLELEPIGPAGIVEFLERNTRPGVGREGLIAMVREALESDDEGIAAMLGSPFNLKQLCAYSLGGGEFPRNEAMLQRVCFAAAYRKEAVNAPETASLEGFKEYLGELAVDALFRRKVTAHPRAKSMRMAREETEYYTHLAQALDIVDMDLGAQTAASWTGRSLGYCAAEYLLTRRTELGDFLAIPHYARGRRIAQRTDQGVRTAVLLAPDTVEIIAQRDPCLAARCLGDMARTQRAPMSGTVVRQLVQLLADRQEDCWVAAAEALVGIGAAAVPGIAASWECAEYWHRRRMVGVLGRIDDANAQALVIRALADINKRVVAEAWTIMRNTDEARRAGLEEMVELVVAGLLPEAAQQVAASMGALFSEWRSADEGVEEGADAAGNRELDRSAVAGPVEARGVATRSMPLDGARVAESRALCLGTATRDKTWRDSWCELADQGFLDHDLQAAGRGWLNSAADSTPGWAKMWVRLMAKRPDDALIMMGRRWLASSHGERGEWPHVWNALWCAVQREVALTRLGEEWLRALVGPSPSWAVVWCAIRDTLADPAEVDQIAHDLLRISPVADASWGHVWPLLIERMPESDARYELGLRWLRRASPMNPAWGFMFPAIWRRKPRRPEIELIGREWLRQVPPNHRSWSFVWCELWNEYPNDDLLAALATSALAGVRIDDPAWGQVFEVAWRAAPRDEQLVKAGTAWIAAESVPFSHPGWTWVYNFLLASGPYAPSIVRRGLAWLQTVEPHRRGWAAVWRATWENKRLAGRDDGDIGTLLTIGRRWLETVGVANDGFSQVWEILWLRNRDDELRRLALDHLWNSPTDSTLMYVWRALTEAVPEDEALLSQGIALVGNHIRWEHSQWNAIWVDLWQRKRGDPGLQRIGMEWLRKMKGSGNLWGDVWAALWTGSARDGALTELGIAGLRASFADARVWKAVWRPLFASHGASNADVVNVAVDWLRSAESHRFEDFWGEVAAPLAAAGKLPADLDESARSHTASHSLDDATKRQCRRIADEYAYAKSWLIQWEEAWSQSTASLLTDVGLRWLEDAASDPLQRAFPYNWKKVFEAGFERDRTIEIGLQWVRRVPSDTRAWGLVWPDLVRSVPYDEAFAGLGVAWLDDDHLSRGTWHEVWAALWDLALIEREPLVRTAMAWLALPRPARWGFANVLCRLWDAGANRSQLAVLAVEFLNLATSHAGWIDVAVRVWSIQRLDDSRRELLGSWVASHQNDELAGNVRALLGASPS